MQLIVPLSDAGSADRSLVGSKAKELGRLLAAGRSVPDGFVVTTSAAELGEGAAAPVEEALATALRTMTGPVAYRSSAVAEDLDHASYAGQYETVLGVEGLADGLDALRRCWASANSDSVESYRSDHGDSDGSIAVIVQEMVPATAAGVTFTANPVTGADEIVIEATAGLGEALMAGDVTPARWVGSPLPVLESEGDAGPVLTEAEVGIVAEECRSIADAAGAPVDVEWAFGGGRLWILQSRAITALPVKPVVEPPRKQTWVRDDAYFAHPISPLAFSAWLPIHSRSFSHVTEHYGLPFDRVDHRHWYGRVYDRFVPNDHVKSDHPLPPLPIAKILFRLTPPIRKRHAIAALAQAEDRPMVAIDAWENGGRETLRSRTKELRRVDRSTLDDAELAGHLGETMDHVLAVAINHFMLAFGGTFILAGQLGLIMDELLDWPPERMLDLVQGYGEASLVNGAALDDLAAVIAGDAIATELLRDDPLAILEHQGPAGEALRAFLDDHGHRLVTADLEESTWAEDPAPLLRMVGARINSSRSGPDPKPAAHAAEAEALAAIADAHDRERFAVALTRARKGRPYGDETETDVGDVLAVVRYIALEAGHRLCASHRLGDASDVFLLTIDEMADALRGVSLPPDLDRRRAEHRWALANPAPTRFGQDLGDPPPPEVIPAKAQAMSGAVLWTLRLFQPQQVESTGDGIRGLPASPGRATGPVRVITSPAEFDRVRPGDILVCHHTMAAWSPIFPVIGGLVTERGGPLSHPGTLAREYSLPAVLSVAGATELFQDGEMITVDGAAGTIDVAAVEV